MLREFKPSEKEYKALAAFEKKHHKSCPSQATIGDTLEISFVPTGIGLGIGVRCLVCKVTKNVTDYDSW